MAEKKKKTKTKKPSLPHEPIVGSVIVRHGPLEPHPPLTLYDAKNEVGYVALVVMEDGSVLQEEKLAEAAAWAKARKLPDGTPLAAVNVVVPIMEAAAALSPRAHAMGIARVVTKAGQGELWDPTPAPLPKPERPAKLPARMTWRDDGVHAYDLGNGRSVAMVYVPAGAFLMGDDASSAAAERPAHLHPMPHGYFIARDEITVAEYRDFCRATGREMPPTCAFEQLDEHPITNVTWSEAKAFCDWAGLALPSEAEWEKAARGTDGRGFTWGDLTPPMFTVTELAVCYENPRYEGRLAPVGENATDVSPYGARGMVGNAAEWTSDWYDPEAYARYAKGDLAPSTKTGEHGRVIRGTNFEGPLSFGRCPSRLSYVEDDGRAAAVGFRPVLRMLA